MSSSFSLGCTWALHVKGEIISLLPILGKVLHSQKCLLVTPLLKDVLAPPDGKLKMLSHEPQGFHLTAWAGAFRGRSLRGSAVGRHLGPVWPEHRGRALVYLSIHLCLGSSGVGEHRVRIADPGLGSPDGPWEHQLAPPHPYLVFTTHEEARSSYYSGSPRPSKGK